MEIRPYRAAIHCCSYYDCFYSAENARRCLHLGLGRGALFGRPHDGKLPSSSEAKGVKVTAQKVRFAGFGPLELGKSKL